MRPFFLKKKKLEYTFPNEFFFYEIRNMTDTLYLQIQDIAKRARAASLALASASTSEKNEALQAIARGLESNRKLLKEENKKDLDHAEENGLSGAMVDRLRLNHERIDSMVKGLRQLIDLPDPVGANLQTKKRPNGLVINKVRVPIGVIGIISMSPVQM